MPAPKPLDPELSRRLGAQLKKRRLALGRSQERVAHQAGVSRNYYQLLEQGLSSRDGHTPANPSLAILVDLARALETPLPPLLVEVFRERSDVTVEFHPGDGA